MCGVRWLNCLRLCNPLGSGPPGSSVRGISQVRILEGVAIFSSMASSRPRDRTHVSCFGSWILYHRAIWEARWGSLLSTVASTSCPSTEVTFPRQQEDGRGENMERRQFSYEITVHETHRSFQYIPSSKTQSREQRSCRKDGKCCP